MSEQQLDRAQVRAGLEQMTGEGVAQAVRGDGLGEPAALAASAQASAILSRVMCAPGIRPANSHSAGRAWRGTTRAGS